MQEKQAVIIGAGPAGLTAALELLERTDIKPVVIEQSCHMGGISRTIEYKGNRMDLGGHRFFSKTDRVMNWWLRLFPLAPDMQSLPADADEALQVMLLRQRKSRIYYLGKFFDYPVTLSLDTLTKLGPGRTMLILLSYLRSAIHPIKDERNLEEFFINRFGRRLYKTFFQSYTEKLWGVACVDISAEWGAQRIKGLSIMRTLQHAARRIVHAREDLAQKGSETSLIEQFLYPPRGPGQMWEAVAARVRQGGGEIWEDFRVDMVRLEGDRVAAVEAVHAATGERRAFPGDHFFSSMPMRELVRCLQADVPASIREVSEGLVYRDFLTVGLLLRELNIRDGKREAQGLVRDNWIYIQEPGVKMGRIQIFNNWSPYLVADPDTVWIGLEYFCQEGDELWSLEDGELIDRAAGELASMGMIGPGEVLDGTVVRMPKAYPAYFGTYERFPVLRDYLDRFENLWLVGRNGLHKYNNQDHSMLTAMLAVDNILEARTDKSNIWDVNVEDEYLEST